MPNAIRSPRRIILLGAAISIGLLGFALPRPASNAQEPAKALDRKTLRDQIIALHVEIDLLEVEQGVDRNAFYDLVREERAIPENLRLFFSGQIVPEPNSFNFFLSIGGQIWSALKGRDTTNDEQFSTALRGNYLFPSGNENGFVEIKELAREQFGKDFAEELARLPKLELEQFSEARMRLAARAMEEIEKKAPERFRQFTAPLKKNFSRRSAEIAGKKLDVDILERQYREAR